MTLALWEHPNIQFPQRDIVGLAEKHSTKEQRISPSTMEGLIKDADTAYKDAPWIEANFGGADTLSKIEKPISALLDLLRDRINRHRLIAQLFQDGDEHLVTNRVTREFASEDKYDELIATLDVIRVAAPKAHRPPQGRRGPKSGKTDLAAAYRRLAAHFEKIFGKPVTNGWTKTKPPLPANASTAFIYDIMRLVDPIRTRLAEDLQDLIEKDIAKTPGPRRGRRDR